MFNNLHKFVNFLTIYDLNLKFLIFLFSIFLVGLIISYKFNIFCNADRILLFKNAVLFSYTVSFLCFLFYFFISIHFKSLLQISNFIYYDFTYNFLNKKLLDFSSLVIIYLCYLIGLISIITLGDRFWAANYGLSIIFLYFLIIIHLLVKSNSLFELFIYYELLLLPSVFFVYKSGYTKKSQQANIYFLTWTQLGSLLVLSAIMYISNKVGSTSFLVLKNFYFTSAEIYYLYILFFLGFGIKVPLWPFHFWLIKVHVESPSGFSIFLSGFLVKTAVYCFYKFSLILSTNSFYIFPVLICILGVLDASLKMWTQTDIKKLIAYATVQEMNAIYLIFVLNDATIINVGLVFLFTHGILSSLMFFLVECIYKRFNTRNLYKIYGVSTLFPNLSLGIWAMLLLFFGFPGTLKFYLEIQLCIFLLNYDFIFTFIFIFIFIFLNVIGFARCWFSLLYGAPNQIKHSNNLKLDITSEESLIIFFLWFLSVIPCFFLYLF